MRSESTSGPSRRTRRATSSLGAAELASRLDLPADPNDVRFAHLLIEAATAAGFDRPDVLSDTADGDALLKSIAERIDMIDRDRASNRWAPGTRWRHDLPVHDGRQGHGRVADPVERGRLRLRSRRAEHWHQPAQPRPRLQPPRRSPRRVRRRASAAAHAVPGDGHGRRRAALCVRHHGRRRPAADPAATCGAAVPLRPVARGRGVCTALGAARARRPGSTRGPAARLRR